MVNIHVWELDYSILTLSKSYDKITVCQTEEIYELALTSSTHGSVDASEKTSESSSSSAITCKILRTVYCYACMIIEILHTTLKQGKTPK